MKFDININNKKLAVELINKKTIKHCYLTIKSSTKLQIRANRYFTQKDAQKLLEKKYNWLLKNIIKLEEKEKNREDDFYLGKIIDDETIEDIDDFYRQKAKEIMPKLVEKNAQLMNLYPSNLKFRKNKTRFGSCSAKNSISMNILLMKYPLSVIEYVIIHELAHIKHKNHSSAFWNLVEEYCEDYKELDAMLKMF